MGVDQNLFSNLESFFTLNYPKVCFFSIALIVSCNPYFLLQYELLFCVEDDTDPVIMLVNSLIEKYPKVDAKVFIGGSDVGVNPKINNMHKAYEAASYEFVLISDSGIRSMYNHVFAESFLNVSFY